MIKSTIKLDPKTAKSLEEFMNECNQAPPPEPASNHAWQSVNWRALLEKQRRWIGKVYPWLNRTGKR